jgi:hypothetical protein
VDNESLRGFFWNASSYWRNRKMQSRKPNQTSRSRFATANFVFEVEWWRQSARPLSSRN